ncbi:LOW QUALITY PROTEIN: sorting nexin-17 [Lepeophtheirus salmonis]|uniref:PX domain-containing protein n=1 Tax=Lepeophtheirus salmonis TaxID=72036 RepID=A0A0K2U379_LEPSM|nr:LOW QUALITY PROTEIN: sorting nexin-17-like [Lepeophtheirus salmonis]
MHFSIPEIQELKEPKGGTYTSYSVHINGTFHCSLRYRQFHALHEQLKREFLTGLPSFPPKKVFPLSEPQKEERRLLLEKYLQLVATDPRIASSIPFNGFLLAAQRETRAFEENQDVSLDVYLMHDHKVTLKGPVLLQSDQVLEGVCAQLGVPDEFVYYFALFLIQRHNNDSYSIVRKLQDFESPYISQKAMSGSLKLVLRKCCWDPDIDSQLFSNQVTLNLLYIQTVTDVERGWVQASQDTKRTLSRMQARGAKLEYMDLARSLKFYGYIHFLPCCCDYPSTDTPVQVAIGMRELVIRLEDPSTGEIKEGNFKVTKMRCWRIMTLTNPRDDDDNKLELSFEYLINNQTLQWVTIVSSQAILMSICLQSIVEELLRKKSRIHVKKAGEKSCTIEYSYPKRDGSYHILPIRAGLHSKSCNKPTDSASVSNNKKNVSLSSLTGRQYSVKRLSEKFDVVNMRDTLAAEDVFIENEAFVDIQDDEL